MGRKRREYPKIKSFVKRKKGELSERLKENIKWIEGKKGQRTTSRRRVDVKQSEVK